MASARGGAVKAVKIVTYFLGAYASIAGLLPQGKAVAAKARGQGPLRDKK